MESNNNPTPNPTPTPNPMPNPNPMPAPDPVPTSPAGSGANDVPPVNPTPVNPTPVNPVINPGMVAQNPIIQPGGQGLAATDPIMKPEPAPAPDPVEEELKAPMKASEPVPGSIGSAISGPSAEAPVETVAENPFTANAQNRANNVAFNDPATQPDNMQQMPNAKPKKKTSKTTLIILIILVILIIGALAVVLVMQMQPAPKSGKTEVDNTKVVAQDDKKKEDTNDAKEPVAGANSVLNCSRVMSEAELNKDDTFTSGTVAVDASFDEKGELKTISLKESVVTTDSATAKEIKNQEALASELTVADGLDYFLSANADGELDLSFDSIKGAYTELDFTCKVL